MLEAAGFPGERALDSRSSRPAPSGTKRWGELSKLERVAESCSFAEAFAFLQRLCANTLFQPESPDAPIQVLGVLESAGLRFDCLWVSGLTDEACRSTRAQPFIPIAAQKKAGIPQASAEASAALDPRIYRRMETPRRRSGLLLAASRKRTGTSLLSPLDRRNRRNSPSSSPISLATGI